MVILAAVSWLTAQHMHSASAELAHHQAEAEEVFVSQPDRNPHRMVHYGHYVFRTPVPLALFDPGLDAVTGKAMFLEGHRQNSATFTAAGSGGGVGGLSWLTPALTYQVFAPLLVVLLGFSTLVRERESGVLASLLSQGVSGRKVVAGKVLALFGFVCLLMVPLAISTVAALIQGESLLAGLALLGLYLVYLCVWVGLTVWVSIGFRSRSAVIAVLASCWLVFTLVLPSVAVNVAAVVTPLAGKIETELAMLTERQDVSDGHSVNNADLERIKTALFQQYGTDKLEELPVNIRGLLAQKAEQDLTAAMNEYAEKRMAGELRQANVLATHGWLTPLLAVAAASRSLSGTDIHHYHKFLRQAETLRYDFVQRINQVQVEQLSYIDDIIICIIHYDTYYILI